MQQYCETAEGEEHKKDTEAEKPPKHLDWEIPGGKISPVEFSDPLFAAQAASKSQLANYVSVAIDMLRLHI